MSSIQETTAAGEMCPGCDSLRRDVEFKTWFDESGDTYVCEDCFNKITEEEDEEEEEEEEEDDDCSSVHSTCCAECGESFKFDVPVSAADYHNNDHDQVCPPCMAKTEEPEAKEPEEKPEDEEEEEEEEWCEEHEQVMWKNGLKCGGCLEGEEEEEEEEED